MIKLFKITFFSACIFFLIITFSVVFIKFGNEFILQHRFPKFISGLTGFLFRPIDLYEHKGRVELLSGKAITSFNAKYLGPYVIEFVPQKNLKNIFINPPKCRARFSITMFLNDKVIFERQIEGNQLSVWSSASETGFTICRFDIPEDIPARKEILLEVQVDAGDDDLAQAGWIFVSRTTSY